jgi:hypothetical protein
MLLDINFSYEKIELPGIQYNKGPDVSGPKKGIDGVSGRVFSRKEL